MHIRRLAVALVATALIPTLAEADPVGLALHSTENGGSVSLVSTSAPLPPGSPVVWGTITLPTVGAAVILSVSGLTPGADYLMEIVVNNAGAAWNTLRAELLDASGDGNDGTDPSSAPGYVPAGYSTSNDTDGLSFAQRSGLPRSATYAGGAATVIADEGTNRGDILMFTGLSGAAGILRVNFGMRDFTEAPFVIRLSAEDDMTPNPEPASMFLLATGLAGIAAARRRARRAPEA